MAIGANSYGTTAGVAGLTPRYATALGAFDASTRPTLTQVESYIDEISGVLNIMLAEQGFAIPVVQADCKLALDLFVNQEAAAIVEGVNGSGRFGPSANRAVQASRFALVLSDVQKFVESHSAGFERLGAERTYSLTEGLGFRDADQSGDATAPIFQRKGFGNVFKDWDA